MATITVNIQVSKQRVMDEVMKTTAYIGSKAVNPQDPDAYNRIAATSANREQLDRYWMEGCSWASMLLDHWMTSQTSQVLTHHPELGNDYKAVLAMPTNWPSQYTTTLHEALLSYLANHIVSKWLMQTAPTQAEGYAALASGAAMQVEQILLMRKRPARRSSIYDDSGEWPWNGDGLWHRADIWHRDELW